MQFELCLLWALVAGVAQPVEQPPCKWQVVGSIPTASSRGGNIGEAAKVVSRVGL